MTHQQGNRGRKYIERSKNIREQQSGQELLEQEIEKNRAIRGSKAKFAKALEQLKDK